MVVGSASRLGGTQANCVGVVTAWGTWLSCEEIGSDAVGVAGKKHGYVFEVSADPAQTTGLPIIGMGRIAHEAAAVDPALASSTKPKTAPENRASRFQHA